MTDAVRALVEASDRLCQAAYHVQDRTGCVFFEGRTIAELRKAVVDTLAAVEAESAREEAVEHAIARKALKAMIEWCEGKRHDAIPVRDAAQKDGEREAEVKWAAIVRTYEIVLSELPRQLSLLGARNFEVVEIPQGEECTEALCPFCEKERFCRNPKRPRFEKDCMAEGCPHPDHGHRPAWCRSRYGVEAKP